MLPRKRCSWVIALPPPDPIRTTPCVMLLLTLCEDINGNSVTHFKARWSEYFRR
jgi:hypothetical protein